MFILFEIYKDILFVLILTFILLFYYFVTYSNSFSGGFCHDESAELGDEYDMSMTANYGTNAHKSNLIASSYFFPTYILYFLNNYYLHKTFHIVVLIQK